MALYEHTQVGDGVGSEVSRRGSRVIYTVNAPYFKVPDRHESAGGCFPDVNEAPVDPGPASPRPSQSCARVKGGGRRAVLPISNWIGVNTPILLEAFQWRDWTGESCQHLLTM